MAQNVEVPVVTPTFFEDTGMKMLQVDIPSEFTIQGDMCQILTLPVEPGQTITTEPGTMAYAADGMKLKVKFGGFERAFSGESIVKVKWENTSNQRAYVALTPNIPGTIIPINLDAMEDKTIKCKRDAFMANIDSGVSVSISTLNAASCLACFCSGMGMIMQSVSGSGWVFLNAHGTIMQKVLAPNEELVVDTNSKVKVDVVLSGGCCTMCCGGEGMFNTTLKGPGLVILCSLPIEKLRQHFWRPPPSGPKNKTGGAK